MIMGKNLLLPCLAFAVACIADSRAQTTADTKPAGGPWDLATVGNLSRVPGLTAAHKELLTNQGFFLAPQDSPKGRKDEYTPNQATHLFHVYERNDYLRFPGFITVDLAIDAVHTYFDAVLRDIEQYQLGPLLIRGLVDLVKEAEALRAGATTPEARAVAERTALFFSVGLRLMKEKATLPSALRANTEKTAKAVEAAQGPLPVRITTTDFDITLARPRGHYTRNKDLTRYFRALSWLSLSTFPVEGKRADVPGMALLARAWLGAKTGGEALERLLDVTSFFVGGSDTAGIGVAAKALRQAMPGAEKATADQLVSPDLQTKLREALVTMVPPPQIDDGGSERQIRLLGKRPFEDAVAMKRLIPLLLEPAASTLSTKLVPALTGARGAAAVLGSSVAREAIRTDLPVSLRPSFESVLVKAQEQLQALPGERWSADAYHGTLSALRPLLNPLSDKAPPLLSTPAWRLRALQAFAGGWAELRHDTILYGAQSGAECDAEDLEPPPCWVEPVPEVYRRLATMIRDLQTRLTKAGVQMGFKPTPKPYGPDGERDSAEMIQPPAEKAKLVLEFLDGLAAVADKQQKGQPIGKDQRTWLSTVGGHVEWMVMAFANTELIAEKDADMAVVADVFSWRPSQQALEVAIARPDLIYAIIPSPKGPVLARGAVMSYREFMNPMDKRMTDEEWRKQIAENRAPARPAWLAPLYAAPVGPVKPLKVTQGRCGPDSGSRIECL